MNSALNGASASDTALAMTTGGDGASFAHAEGVVNVGRCVIIKARRFHRPLDDGLVAI
jgi:hypothetical protein